MSDFFFNYGLFLVKVLTIVVAIVIIIGVAASAGRKAHQEGLEVEDLNKKYKALASASAKSGAEKRRAEKGSEGREKAREGGCQGIVRPAAQLCHQFQRRPEGECAACIARGGQCGSRSGDRDGRSYRLSRESRRRRSRTWSRGIAARAHPRQGNSANCLCGTRLRQAAAT